MEIFKINEHFPIAVKTKEILMREYPDHSKFLSLLIYDVALIGFAYLRAKEIIDEEERKKRQKEEAERIAEKDIGWFPGDCCD